MRVLVDGKGVSVVCIRKGCQGVVKFVNFLIYIYDDNEAKAELKRLQNDFVIVPIDKAANNIAFICKQHYAHVLFS